eukprot:TRINITY_DN1439_c0_g1_i5.p1 TRINITY_DN1439_c0_g1~~TRINITY_DN1439_c0_g1_i5.p1  ORF type:complete len:326 (+),score=46.69 TRINITY_DN1439_c0_g1_i5:369-1346(+)
MGTGCWAAGCDPGVGGHAEDDEDDGFFFFALLGAEARGIYPPEELLRALPRHPGADGNVRPVPVPRGPKAARPPSPDAPPLGSPGRAGLSRSPKAQPKSTAQPNVDALSGQLLDALLVGLGLVHSDVGLAGAMGPVTKVVRDGWAVFVRSAIEAPFVVWAGTNNSGVCAFCSCAVKNENVRALVRTATSSSCRHAAAYMLALRGVASNLLCSSIRNVLKQFPSIDNSAVNTLNVDAVEVQALDDSAALHVVGHQGNWCVAHSPEVRTRKVPPVCQSVPRRTRNVHCIHSMAVKPPVAGFGDFDERPAGDDGYGDREGDDGGGGDG